MNLYNTQYINYIKTFLILAMTLELSACLPFLSPSNNHPEALTLQPGKPTITTIPNTPLPTPDYGDNYKAVQLAWFYKPPSSGDLSLIAHNYSSIILTRQDEAERDLLHALGVKTPILQYLLFAEIQDPGSCTESPYHNNVAEKIGDFCTLVKQHPDWFLIDLFNKGIASPSNYYMMDPGNKGWQTFWLERARTTQENLGWQGVFLDNVEASLDKRIQRGGIPQKYMDNASYQAAIEENLQYIYLNYFKPKDRPLYANIISLNDPAVWFRYLQYLDGAMLENFAVGWNDDYKSVSAWEMDLELVEKTQAMGKSVILVSQGNEFDSNRQVFALASFLLVNNGKASFRYTNSDTYDQNWLYDNYHQDLGKPLGVRYKEGNTWKRVFQKGNVSVSADTNTASIIMN